MRRQTIHLLWTIFVLFLLISYVSPAAADGQLHEAYRAAYQRYQQAVARMADEETLASLRNELEQLQDALGMNGECTAEVSATGDRNSLIEKLSDAVSRGDGADADARAAALLAQFAGDLAACRAAVEQALPASPQRHNLLCILQTVSVRQAVTAFVGTYDRRVEEARQEYRKRSWWNPIGKLAAAWKLRKEKFARGKAHFTYRTLFNPKENQPYVSYGSEILNEIGHVIPYYRKVFHETKLDTLSVLWHSEDGEPVDELVFYTIPSPHGMDWTSPFRLGLISGAFNQITFKEGDKKHLIGHNFISLNRRDGRRQLRGMTTTSQEEETDLVLKHGYGLGILFADLMGKFDDPEHIQAELDYRYEKGLVSRIRFLLSPSTAERLQRFLDEYTARGCQEHYGGANRARYGEGGGCSPFATAFLDLAGLWTDEYARAWVIDLNLPLEHCGGPAFGRRVNAFKTLATIKRWARDDEPHAKISMIDPTLMFRWIENTWKKEFRQASGEWMLEKDRGSLCLVKDCRNVPTPTDPIWREPDGDNPWRQHGYRYGKDPWAFDLNGNPVRREGALEKP